MCDTPQGTTTTDSSDPAHKAETATVVERKEIASLPTTKPTNDEGPLTHDDNNYNPNHHLSNAGIAAAGAAAGAGTGAVGLDGEMMMMTAAAATATATKTTNPTRNSPRNRPHPSAAAAAAAAAAVGHEGFVQPSSYLRPRAQSRPMTPAAASAAQHQHSVLLSAVDRDQKFGLKKIQDFLKVRTSYDVLPMSFRLIVFDTTLLVKKSLNILLQNGIVSAPLWDSKTSTFAGLLTTSDYINVIQYYWANPDALNQVEMFRLNSLRALGVTPIETVSINPLKSLYEACRRMLESRARRIPLVDVDDETQRAMIVSVVTQYRILKFVAVNVTETRMLRKPLKDLDLGTYEHLETAKMATPVIEVIHKLVRHNISSVPILNSEGVVINVFEAVDVITLIKGGIYEDLNLKVGEALQKRSEDFPGIYTCSIHDRLDTIFDTIRKSRVHRFVIIDEDSRLKGVLTLSDILEYILLEGEGEDAS